MIFPTEGVTLPRNRPLITFEMQAGSFVVSRHEMDLIHVLEGKTHRGLEYLNLMKRTASSVTLLSIKFMLTCDDPLKPHSRFETSLLHTCGNTLETAKLCLSRTPNIDLAMDYA